MKKRLQIHWLLPILLGLLVSCAPNTKEKYLQEFEQFIDEVQSDYEKYDVAQWNKMTTKYVQFADEWYKKYESQLTLRENLKIAYLESKWEYYRNLNDLTDEIKDFSDNIESDAQELMEDAQKMSDSLNAAISDIISDYNEKE